MRYRSTNTNPDKVLTVQLDDKLHNELIRFYNKRENLSDRHIFLSEIIRDAINQKISKVKLTKKRIPKKTKMGIRVNFTATDDLWKRIKRCADQTSKSQNEFVRNCLTEFLDKN